MKTVDRQTLQTTQAERQTHKGVYRIESGSQTMNNEIFRVLHQNFECFWLAKAGKKGNLEKTNLKLLISWKKLPFCKVFSVSKQLK